MKIKTIWHFRKSVDIITDFLNFREEIVVLNGQYFSWSSTEAGALQGSILEQFLFLIYIIDLSDHFTINVKLLSDDTTPFSAVHNIDTSAINLNNNVNKIKDKKIHWKISILTPVLVTNAGSYFSWRKRKFTI